jgi:ribonuclease HI
MTKRRKKKVAPTIHLSAGPLPERLAQRFPDQALLFTDASRLRHGGLAAIIYRSADAEPEIFTRSVPLDGSNELELQAAIFGLQRAALLLPELPFALFSDNQDAVVRLTRVKQSGASQDQQLTSLFPDTDFDTLLRHAELSWVQGHGRCRGNALADEQARVAAGC